MLNLRLLLISQSNLTFTQHIYLNLSLSLNLLMSIDFLSLSRLIVLVAIKFHIIYENYMVVCFDCLVVVSGVDVDFFRLFSSLERAL